MEFRTIVHPIAGRRGLVRHGEPLLLVGSCFSDNIGTCLTTDLFDADVNPFGPLYNPVSISNAFKILNEDQEVGTLTLLERDGMWVSTLFHSRISSCDRSRAIEKMNARIHESASTLRRASVIIITLGTTRIFTLRESGQVVVNCHKLPGNAFDVSYLSLDETVEALHQTVESIRTVNRNADIIFTVSPLRYSEQGAHGNQLAKATLMLAVDHLISETADPSIEYFPAYEIMMDDLRDYRFYAEDMKHPSAQAVRYIYDIFKQSYFDDETMRIAEEAGAFTRRLAHRALGESGATLDKSFFEKKVLAEKFMGKYPVLRQACEKYLEIICNNGI